jgi:hypothetical protein
VVGDDFDTLNWPPKHTLCVVLAITAASAFSQTDRTKMSEQEDACISAEAAHHLFRGDVLVGIDGRIVFEKAYELELQQHWVHFAGHDY